MVNGVWKCVENGDQSNKMVGPPGINGGQGGEMAAGGEQPGNNQL